jgi:hypothetical protein
MLETTAETVEISEAPAPQQVGFFLSRVCYIEPAA